MTATVPQPSFLGALKNIGRGLYTRTAKFASYGASQWHPTIKRGNRIGTNPNSGINSIQRIGMAFTAEMVSKDNPLASAYIGQRQNYCSSLLTYIPTTGDTGLDEEITAYLHGADGTGGYFSTMGVACSMQDAFTRTADLETPVRGDAGMIFWRDEAGDLRLMEFSADQLGEPYQYTQPKACSITRLSSGELREVNGSDCIYFAGRYMRGADAVAYKVYERTDAYYGTPRIYDAADVLYFRDPAFYRGLRGVTAFSNGVSYMQKSDDLMQSALSIAQRQARTSAYVFNNSGMPNELDVEVNTLSDGTVRYTERISEGPIVEYNYNGDSVIPVAPNAPGTDVIDGVDAADQKFCIAMRSNYACLIAATKVGGAPSRLEVEKQDKEWQRIQRCIHRPQLNRIRDVILMDASNRGIIRRPYGMTMRQFLSGVWQLPTSAVVDAFYDAKENIANTRAGLEAPQDIIAETNRNPKLVMQKTKQWAIDCSIARQEANRELVRRGYNGDVTAADIAQVSDNPQQAAQSEVTEKTGNATVPATS